MTPSRRNLFAAPVLVAGLAGTVSAHGAEAEPLTPLQAAADAPDPDEVIKLWPRSPPGAPAGLVPEEVLPRSPPHGMRDRAVIHVATPTLTVFRSRASHGGTVLIIPGGGYARVVVDKEGFETARYLASRGYTAFVLRYRLPGDPWAAGPDVALQDAQRAMRLIRASLGEAQVNRIAVIGFSAGGHVAGSLATRGAETTYPAVDDADAAPASPNAACLIYSVISMREAIAHPGSRQEMFRSGLAGEEDRYSLERRVTATAPPTFLCHAADDTTVPVENSLEMFKALKAAKVPAEMHIFEDGQHGFGMRFLEAKSARAWPELMTAWLRKHGV